MIKLITLLMLSGVLLSHCFAQPQTSADSVVMVPPSGFGYNSQTAVTNKYQVKRVGPDLLPQALAEFNAMVNQLRKHGINVLVFDTNKQSPDAVFPNNWFSTHAVGEGKIDIAVYPMLTPNRQSEVKPQLLKQFLQKKGIKTNKIIDFRNINAAVLEGTGSLILDRVNHVLYASLSPRTNLELVKRFAKAFNYQVVIFSSTDEQGHLIYHTNVMMGLAQKFAVVCLQCIEDPVEKQQVVNALGKTNKTIIAITRKQVAHMCGNVLELKNKLGDSYLVMSTQAYQYFTEKQKKIIKQSDKIIAAAIPTIETIGGGSARCMLAELYA